MTASLGVRPAQDSETPATLVFTAPIQHPSAWTVADFRSPADYSVDLEAAQLFPVRLVKPIDRRTRHASRPPSHRDPRRRCSGVLAFDGIG